MHVAVFGATGRTGRPLVEQAVERGHEVVAFARDRDDLPAVRDDEAVTVVTGDAYTGEGVAEAVAPGGDPVDAVVSVLGQTSEDPDDLLTVAGRHVHGAMDDHGVERFVTLVGAGVREAGESVSLGGKVMGVLLKVVSGEVLHDAEAHVEDVRATDLRWTVVRAPRLTEGAHTGEFRHGPDLELGMRDAAARANVAHFVLDCLEAELYVGELPKVADA
jgi:putative NADH-flavin reductase